MRRRLPKLLGRFWFLSLLLSIAFLIIWAISLRIATPATPSTTPIQRALSTRIPQVTFADALFRERLDFLSAQTGIQIELDAEVFDQIDSWGTQPGKPFAATNATVGEILNSMQAQLNPNLHFWTHESWIRLSKKGTQWHSNREERHEPDFIFQYQQKVAPKAPPRPNPLWGGVIGPHRYTLVAARGGLRLWITPPDPALIYQQGTPIGNATDPAATKLFEFAGLSIRGSGSPFDTRIITLPFWSFASIAAIPSLLALQRKLHEKRCQRLARCPTCGYDLHATPDRCPECGRETASAEADPTASLASKS